MGSSGNKVSKPSEQDSKKNKRLVVIFACAAVLVAAGVFLGVWLTGRGEPEVVIVHEPAPTREYVGSRGTVITEDNLEDIRDLAEERRRFSHYEARMSIDWEFETSSSPSRNVYVENLPTNPGTVFFELVLPETGELLFTSPYIPLGGRLDSVTLDVDLPPGVYRPHVIYHLVNEDYEVMATVTVEVTMRILN